MTYRSDYAGITWICGICDGAEISAPGYEPPSPAICPTCARLSVLDALAALGVTL